VASPTLAGAEALSRRTGRRSHPTLIAWSVYVGAAATLALLGIAHWVWAVLLRGPVLYGEGAVAHAAILARGGLEYTAGGRYGDVAPIFTAANYPPLFFHLAGIGDDPFVTGRLLSIASTLFVAGAIAWRARAGGGLVAAALALAWLGSVPVLQWGSAVKPDLVALALTVAAIAVLDRDRSTRFPVHSAAGALLGLAAMAKPTALLPALAIFVFIARRDPKAAARGLGAGLLAAIVASALTQGFDKIVKVHVIDWNALPWRGELAIPLILLAAVLLAVPIITVVVTRPHGAVTAYAIGAVGILLLGGREGATINYLLDLSAALALSVAGRAAVLASGIRYPIAALAQAAVAVALLNPFGVIQGRTVSTGAWGDPARIEAMRDVPGTVLVEDSGLLVANGREPIVDDIFLWSRNYARSREESGVQWIGSRVTFNEGATLINAVRAARFDAIVSEAELGRLDQIGGYERQRWHPDLVAAILERYALERTVGPDGRALFVYTRR
jgi:hypothetical protein